MFRLFLILLIPIFSFSVDYSEDTTCCSQYGKTNDISVSRTILKHSIYSGIAYSKNYNGNPKYQTLVQSYKDNGNYNGVRYCVDEGVVSINDINSEFTNGESWVQLYSDGNPTSVYTRNDLNIYTRHIHYSCKCDQESTDPDFSGLESNATSQWEMVASKACNGDLQGDYDRWLNADFSHKQMVSWNIGCCGTNTNYYLLVNTENNCTVGQDYIGGACYDPCEHNQTRVNLECVDSSPTSQNCHSLHDSRWLIVDGVHNEPDCLSSANNGERFVSVSYHQASGYLGTCCGLPTKLPFDCSTLGFMWYPRSVESESQCGVLVDGVNIDSASFKSGSDISSTCCVHLVEDLNGSSPDSSDSNGSSPDSSDSNGSNASSLGSEEIISNAKLNKDEIISNATSNKDEIISSLNSFDFNTQTSLNHIGSSIDSLRIESQSNFDGVSSQLDTTNDTLSDISRALSSDSDDENEDFSQLSSILSDGVSGITSRFSSFASYNLGGVPSFSNSSLDCDYSFTISYGTYAFNLRENLSMIAPYLSSLWSFLFIYISFIMYYRGFIIVLNFV